MKKKVLARLKSVAESLPVILTTEVRYESIPGFELLKEGLKSVNGKPIDPKGSYRQGHEHTVPVNHLARIKDIYARQGESGILEYQRHTQKIAKEQVAQAERQRIQQLTEEKVNHEERVA